MDESITFRFYRMLVEEVREARRARRELSNIFMGLNVAGAGFIAKGDAAFDPVLAAVLLLTCWIWRTSNHYYTLMLSEKYKIIYGIEATLEHQPIKAEWDALSRYKPMKSFTLERALPLVFIVGYSVFLAYQITPQAFMRLVDTVVHSAQGLIQHISPH